VRKSKNHKERSIGVAAENETINNEIGSTFHEGMKNIKIIGGVTVKRRNTKDRSSTPSLRGAPASEICKSQFRSEGMTNPTGDQTHFKRGKG